MDGQEKLTAADRVDRAKRQMKKRMIDWGGMLILQVGVKGKKLKRQLRS